MSTETTMQNYQELALRTESPITPELIERLTGNARAVHAFFGLLTETGELADGFKRAIFYGKPLDTTNIKEEVGDVFWYLAILCDILGINFIDCMSANIEKLRKRFPTKYSHEAALNRDLEAERKVLETPKAFTGESPDLPWLQPNSHGEKPNGICCQRATGQYCYEHNRDNYTYLGGEFVLKYGTTLPEEEKQLNSLPWNAPTLGEILNKPPKELPFVNGFDCARELASWMDGQTRERALKHITNREQQYKESLGMTPAEKDEKDGNDTLNSIRRATSC